MPAATRLRKAMPAAREATRLRKAMPAAKEATQRRMALPENVDRDCYRKRARRSAKSSCGPEVSRGDRGKDTLGSEGTWMVAARRIAEEEGRCQDLEALSPMPPSFALLNDDRSLQLISEMYQCLGEGSTWTTCVVCWKAWYAVPSDAHFSNVDAERQCSMGRARDAWFAVKQNQILEHWCFASSDSHDADDFLNAHYTVEMANILRRQLREVGRREIAVCAECGKIVQDNALLNTMGALRRVDMAVDPVAKSLVNGFAVVRERWHEQVPSSSTDQALLVDRGTNPLHDGQATGASDTSCTPVLGYPLDVIAPAMAALSDFEEMVISLVHPLVQVYTIPTTGELAYV